MFGAISINRRFTLISTVYRKPWETLKCIIDYFLVNLVILKIFIDSNINNTNTLNWYSTWYNTVLMNKYSVKRVIQIFSVNLSWYRKWKQKDPRSYPKPGNFCWLTLNNSPIHLSNWMSSSYHPCLLSPFLLVSDPTLSAETIKYSKHPYPFRDR